MRLPFTCNFVPPGSCRWTRLILGPCSRPLDSYLQQWLWSDVWLVELFWEKPCRVFCCYWENTGKVAFKNFRSCNIIQPGHEATSLVCFLPRRWFISASSIILLLALKNVRLRRAANMRLMKEQKNDEPVSIHFPPLVCKHSQSFYSVNTSFLSSYWLKYIKIILHAGVITEPFTFLKTRWIFFWLKDYFASIWRSFQYCQRTNIHSPPLKMARLFHKRCNVVESERAN